MEPAATALFKEMQSTPTANKLDNLFLYHVIKSPQNNSEDFFFFIWSNTNVTMIGSVAKFSDDAVLV